jgi:serine phosphatase RsbU (regulator of sigma subunit)
MTTFGITNTHVHPELDYYAFCQCAAEHTGNFYDFIPRNASRLAISFGDLPAAGEAPSITIPGMQALVRGLTAGNRGDLAEVARELNATLYLLAGADLCAPWFYALADPAHRELRYVNAGHEPPLLIRRNGDTVERLEHTGAALGLSARSLHRQETTAMEPGDVLAVFSEGVSEVLSDARMLAVILDPPQAGAAELTRRAMEEVQHSTSRPWLGEDCTFAAVRMVAACRHPLAEERAAEGLALCAA